ncbi:uncharacterized protein LOC119669806 [Teleopsis dalmanni]|uniref:uncharacterized protein LOC119669806 n=1 Tax=Teleopsis dalmanni TaxID=139649 RepID=UPI0018CD4A43|nr:uncharacterized protein LOC119669806 [Teleopsis dalmanni]XP_037935760.1 uncharacterized protein LOC119669806 [Teleopsis dalmanni]XP_037935761.1 uncharacterized protein LOC119669806 [Teleopsis dalmanni]
MFRKCFASDDQYDESFNDSFETLEKMCDKTASDPDSTLHKYLYGDLKDGEVQDGMNKPDERNLVSNLQKMHIDQTKEFKNISCGDMTQLDDIEPPTRLWENTFLDLVEPEISPVKMVGLMRPSTIMEENNESEVSRISYHTAKKDSSSEITTSSYSTAYDYCNLFKYDLPDKAKQAFVGADVGDTHSNNSDLICLSPDNKNENMLKITSGSKNADISKLCFDVDDKNITHIDLECDDSIIDLVSDEDNTYDQDEIEEMIKSTMSLNAIKQETESSRQSKNEIDVSKQSLNFDDTMEEVDYLINKYMAQTNAKIANNAIKMKEAEAEAAKVTETIDLVHEEKTPGKVFEEPLGTTKRLYERGENKENRYAFNMNMPKLDLFQNIKTPVKKTNNEFNNVVSPIRAYIHKTSTTPLMTRFKPISTTSNINDSPVFKKLDFMSHNVGKMSTYDERDLIPNVPTKLPKKAYISSECKNFFDERQPVKIPGGPKIHKFLDSATLPAVVRHEGKTKIPPGLLDAFPKDAKKEVPHQNDSTLVGLEVQEGEMSVYTIKDAQQFK